MLSAQDIIKTLDLKPLPVEGGYYRESYRSVEILKSGSLSASSQGERSLCTAIYYLLTPETCSKLHRLPGVEIFHFYLGDAVEMILLYPDGRVQEIVLGTDLASGHQVQAIVPAGVWQGSILKSGGRFALMGTTMSPGFDFSDYQPGQRVDLIAQYPDKHGGIKKLTLE